MEGRSPEASGFSDMRDVLSDPSVHTASLLTITASASIAASLEKTFLQASPVAHTQQVLSCALAALRSGPSGRRFCLQSC